MKNKIIYIFVFFVTFFPFSSHAATSEVNQNSEQIDAYNVVVNIDQKGDLRVEEDIYYNFGKNVKHGIYRDIPLKETKDVTKLQIGNIQVKDERGNNYTKSISTERNVLQIKIGDADKLVTGSKVYKIFYTVTGAQIRGEKDILSWNAIGTSWNVPINHVSIVVIYPQTFSNKLLTSDCHFGSHGSGSLCTRGEQKGTSLKYLVPKLFPNQGSTITLEFQKGTFLPPTLIDQLQKYVPLLFPLGLFFILLIWWRFHGKDPKGKGIIIPQFEAPNNLSPLEVGAIVDEKIQGKDVSAQIIYLAMQGHLKIVEDEKGGILGGKDFSLIQISPIETAFENEFDKILFGSLFALAKKDENGNMVLTLSQLKTKFSKQFKQIQDSVYSTLIQKGYFPHNPMKIRQKYYVVGGILLYFSIRIFTNRLAHVDNYYWPIACILSAIIILIFAPLMSAKTQKGVEAYEHIEGLKLYLSVAEKDRINFHNAPEKNPQTFEYFLPLAMTLGVEKAWAKYFEGMYMEPPRWYGSSVSGQAFHSMYFASSLSSFSTKTGSSLASAPRSSGGRGGFSGGGRGGGGGGSW